MRTILHVTVVLLLLARILPAMDIYLFTGTYPEYDSYGSIGRFQASHAIAEYPVVAGIA